MKVAEIMPFPSGNEINDKKHRDKAAAHLREARDNEKNGLELLDKIVKAL